MPKFASICRKKCHFHGNRYTKENLFLYYKKIKFVWMAPLLHGHPVECNRPYSVTELSLIKNLKEKLKKEVLLWSSLLLWWWLLLLLLLLLSSSLSYSCRQKLCCLNPP